MGAKKDTGTHERLQRSEVVQGSSDRSFGIVFAVVFGIIAIWPLLHEGGLRWWSLIIGLGFLAVSFVRPTLLAPLNYIWTKFGLLLHRIVNPLIMGILFFIVVTPIGLVMRLGGKDLLRLRFEPNQQSYWIEREPPGPAPDSMKHQF